MMLLLFAAVAQQIDPPAGLPTQPAIAGPASPADIRYHRCFEIAQQSPSDAIKRANQWLLAGGGFMARECLGLAYANQGQWSEAAATFEAAAREAMAAKDSRAGPDWSEAGNAWLAAGKPERAIAAFGGALALGSLDDKQAGEARLDRARAFVAKGDLADARTDLDRALADVPDDSLAWLLSATLARRTGDLARAHKDIAEALKRAPKAPQVQLEAGNIAAKSGDAAGARAAWQQAVALGPDSDAGRSAAFALKQFDQPPPASPQAGD